VKLDKVFRATGKPFLYYPGFVERFGISINATLLLCYVGWRTVPLKEGEWLSATTKQICDATGLTVKEQTNARAQLVAKRLLAETYARLEHTLKFKLSDVEMDDGPPAKREDAHPPKGRVAPAKREGGTRQKGVSSKGGVKEKERDGGADAPGLAPKRQLTDGFKAAWEERFKGPYSFQGAKDGKAADVLLATGISIPDLLCLARKAWERLDEFNCKHAVSLAGFASRFNEIRVEVQNGKSKVNGASGSKGFDRNQGTLNEGKSERYDLKKIQAARAVRDAEQPASGADA